MEVSQAFAILELANVQLEQYLWRVDVINKSRNAMILSDLLIELDDDPLMEKPTTDGKVFYCHNRRYFTRRGDTQLLKMTQFLVNVLKSISPQTAVIVPTNDDSLMFSPDPLFFEHEVQLMKTSFEYGVQLMENLGIAPGEQCAIECSLPDDAYCIGRMANWYWNCHGRNLYIICNTGFRVVVCHEQDLHFCSLDREQIEPILRKAEEFGLLVAPFDSQQCP